MENKGNNSVQASMKSSLHLLNRQPASSESHQSPAFSSARPKRKILNFPPRRRSEWEGNENSKEKGGYRWCLKSPSPSLENSKQLKLKTKISSENANKANKVYWLGSPVSNSLLSLALEAQQRTIATVRLLRNSFRNKAEGIYAKRGGSMGLKEEANPINAPVKLDSFPSSALFFFENSYASCLEEIFQSWLNLMYLITNLKTILNRLLEVSGKEPFKPDIEFEKAVITQATECIAFLSRLKMKSVIESLDEVDLANDPKLKNFQILDFEERISSSFFSEMETLSKRAKELMEQCKKERPREEN